MITELSRSRRAKQTPTASFFVRDAGEAEAFLVASVPAASGAATRAAAEVYSQIAETLCSRGLQIVQERIFGSLTSRNAVMATRADVFLAQGIPPEGPVTYLQGNPPWGEGLSGVISVPSARPDWTSTKRSPTTECLAVGYGAETACAPHTPKPRRSAGKPWFYGACAGVRSEG